MIEFMINQINNTKIINNNKQDRISESHN